MLIDISFLLISSLQQNRTFLFHCRICSYFHLLLTLLIRLWHVSHLCSESCYRLDRLLRDSHAADLTCVLYAAFAFTAMADDFLAVNAEINRRWPTQVKHWSFRVLLYCSDT
jgi:hypothetical protein